MGDTPAEAHRPVVDFDHHRVSSAKHVWEESKELRETCPVAWSEHHGGFWVVSGYEYVQRVHRDYADFTSRRLGDPEYASFQIPPMRFPLSIPEEFDPPESLKYRRRLNQILSPAASAALEPRVRHWTTHFIDRVIERGECDLAHDIATMIPSALSLEWIGMPNDVLERAGASYHEYLGYPHDDPRSQHGWEDVAWLNGRVREELEDRRVNPRDDLLTWLVESELNGERLPFDEIVDMTCILVAAGIDTTTNAIAWSLLHLGRNPQHRDELRENPDLWPTAIEEFLRRYPPVTAHARTAVRDVELGGCLISAGERVLSLESSACHDEDQFPNAQDVVLDRFPNRHFAFGIGSHRCVGMHLARLEMRVVLSEVIERMPDYTIDESKAAPYPDQGNVAGWLSIPATFTPGERLGAS